MPSRDFINGQPRLLLRSIKVRAALKRPTSPYCDRQGLEVQAASQSSLRLQAGSAVDGQHSARIRQPGATRSDTSAGLPKSPARPYARIFATDGCQAACGALAGVPAPSYAPLLSLQREIAAEQRKLETTIVNALVLIAENHYDQAVNSLGPYAAFASEMPRVDGVINAAFKHHFENGQRLASHQDWERAEQEFGKAAAIRSTYCGPTTVIFPGFSSPPSSLGDNVQYGTHLAYVSLDSAEHNGSARVWV